MKYIKYSAIVLMILALAVVPACTDDYLNTVSTQSVAAASVNKTVGGLYIALNGIHRKMVAQDRGVQNLGGEPGFMFSRDAHGDDMTWRNNPFAQGQLNWTINTNNNSGQNVSVWRTYYQFILNANMILEALDGAEKESADDVKLADYIKGECLAIRAWAHFQLVQYYAKAYRAGVSNTQLGVPYKMSSEVKNQSRDEVEVVYTKINADLDASVALLKGYKADVTHYTEKVVWGLKARVALTQQNYAKAAEYAEHAIAVAESEGRILMTKEQVMNGFSDITTATKEALYAAKTLDDQTVYFYSYYAYMSWNFNSTAVRQGVKCISESTYHLMSPTDLRRAWWDTTGTASVPSSSYAKDKYQNRKFTARSSANGVGDVAFMRLSELYLIAAEGYSRSGDDADAKKFFGKFVAERDPAYTDKGNTGSALADEIMTHRRIELWGEGFRWFDLKRLNLPCKREGSNFDISFCGFLQKEQTDSIGWCYEIPRAETDNNSLMKSNY